MNSSQELVTTNKQLIAKRHTSGFAGAHDTFNAVVVASDQNVYYILSSNTLEGGRMYKYNPLLETTEFLADLTEICGEKNIPAIPQGMSHARMYERDGKLYIATNLAYYQLIGSYERLPVDPPIGYELYPGGHLLSYDLHSGKFTDLVKITGGEGIVTMNMDVQRGQIYSISWPSGRFLHYDINNDKLTDLGPVSAGGEAGNPGDDYRVLCRSLLIDPRDGNVYMSTSEGQIAHYDLSGGHLSYMDGLSLKRDYFGNYDYTFPRTMGYNWRKIFWHDVGQVAYGVHGTSGYLFRFDPSKPEVELVQRITSLPSQKSGMNDQFTYGYLGFILGPDKETIYYLTGGPIPENGDVSMIDDKNGAAARKAENLHLVTYHIPKGTYTDHGPIFYENGGLPSHVNSIAVAADGTIYTLARENNNGESKPVDLISIANPFK